MLNIATWAAGDLAATDSAGENRFSGAGDERRMHVQACRYWQSRANDGAMPRLSDCLDVMTTPFAARLALIELARPGKAAEIRAIGAGLEADLAPDRVATRRLFEEFVVRLPQVVAEQAPVGFEAELPVIASADVDYAFRGVLLPLADDEGALSYVFAVMNYRWGDAGDRGVAALAALFEEDRLD